MKKYTNTVSISRMEKSLPRPSQPSQHFFRSLIWKRYKHNLCIIWLLSIIMAGCGAKGRANAVQNTGENAAAAGVAITEGISADEDGAAQKSGEDALANLALSETDEADNAPVICEAEEARLLGGTKIENKLKGFSGTGYVTGFEKDGDSCEFSVNIDEPGFYDLNFISSSGKHGYKENTVYINGAAAGVVAIESEAFTDSVIKRIYLDKGENKVLYEKYWGWVYLDRLEAVKSEPLGAEVFDVPARLVNENATDRTKRLMSYLTDVYGEYILTGQYCDSGINGFESFTIRNATGKRPAVLGLDLMDYTPSRTANGSVGKSVEHAIEFDEMGGIVTMCWHWNAPEDYLTDIWWRGFYKDATNIDLAKIMNGEDEKGYELLIRDIDAIAEQLKRLQEADVPILWRPLHEASGGWFWWGAAGSEACIDLWRLMYDRMTVYHGLNNLIWLWNGQSGDWYPGDEYVDIIGEDIYAGERVYSSQIGKFMEALEYSNERKMVVLSECGTLFDPDMALRDGAMWGFFATWGGDFVLRGEGLTMYSEKYTEKTMLEKVYAHEKTLTLDELPDLKTYTINTNLN